MLYDTCDYHILHYSPLITLHHITTVLIVDLTSKRMNNSLIHSFTIRQKQTSKWRKEFSEAENINDKIYKVGMVLVVFGISLYLLTKIRKHILYIVLYCL